MIGALEDFDHDRILFFGLGGSPVVVNMMRNGKAVGAPFGPPMKVKISGAVITHEGVFEDPESAHDQRLGYWMELEATDTLSYSVKVDWPQEGDFSARYDPDAGWKTSFQWKEAEKNRRKPADAYEISRKSLLRRVAHVLGKQEKCLVRCKDRSGLELQKFSEAQDDDVITLRLVISDKVIVKEELFQKEMSQVEVGQHLQLSREAAELASLRLQVVIEVSPRADDVIFRATLKTVADKGLRMVEFLQRKVGGKEPKPTGDFE